MKILTRIFGSEAGDGIEAHNRHNGSQNFDFVGSRAGSGEVPRPQEKRNPYFWWAVVIGTGAALFPIHNQWLTMATTTKSGVTTFFLPTIALLLTLMATAVFFVRGDNWKTIKASGWGDLKVVIPMGVIVLAIGLSGITAPTISGKIAPLFTGLMLLSMYFASRLLGRELFIPAGIGVVIGAVGIIVFQITHPGTVTGGYVFEGNYDIAIGYILLGAALFIHRWRWVVVLLAIIAILLSGSPEGLFSLAIVGVVALIRRDWPSRKVLIWLSVVIAVLVLVAFRVGLFDYAIKAGTNTQSAAYSENASAGVQPISYRLQQIENAMTHIKPLGNGYVLTAFYKGIVHNVPLIIVQELGWPGVLAGIAWLWITVYCLIKTKWKYAWVLVLSLSVLDHFLWDQLVMWWWMLAGVSLASSDNDYIFRRAS